MEEVTVDTQVVFSTEEVIRNYVRIRKRLEGSHICEHRIEHDYLHEWT